MRVLLVTHYYPQHRSGVELVAGELARRLASRGISITWAASGPLTDNLPAAVTALPMRSWNGIECATGFAYPLWHPRDLGRLASAVRDHDIIHLHEHLYLGNLAAHLAGRRCARPVIVTQHTSQIWSSQDLSLGLRAVRAILAMSNRTLGRLVLAGAERTIFISAKARDYFAQLIPFCNPPLYVPNGVDLTKFRPLDQVARKALRCELGWSPHRPAMLFAGRMIAKKGLPVLRGLAARLPECDWYFAGWGPIDPASWGLANVHCLGVADHGKLARYYQAADLFVLPSLTEGFPLVVQEAMACGTPALVSVDTASGAPESLPYLITADVVVDTLEAKLREVLPSLGDRRCAVAEFAREHWDWERCVDAYEAVLNHLNSPTTKYELDSRSDRRSC
jgi:phosphatidyl-myo-inositol dimannoside synthase